MGRKPIKDKKIKISIAIRNSILKEIKEKESNLSKYIEYLIKKDLNDKI